MVVESRRIEVLRERDKNASRDVFIMVSLLADVMIYQVSDRATRNEDSGLRLQRSFNVNAQS